MAVFSQTTVFIGAGSEPMSAYVQEGEWQGECEELDGSNYASGGWNIVVPGLAKSSLQLRGMQDYVVGGPADTFTPATRSSLNAYVVSYPGTVAGDPSFITQGKTTKNLLIGGRVGELAALDYGIAGDGRAVRSLLLHPSAARTASGSGTAVAFTTPITGESIWAAFNVYSVTGAGTLTLTVQTDDNAGFTTPTTRITSTGFTAVGSQFTSVAGPFAGETHIRAGWTVTGFTSVTFTVAAGVAA